MLSPLIGQTCGREPWHLAVAFHNRHSKGSPIEVELAQQSCAIIEPSAARQGLGHPDRPTFNCHKSYGGAPEGGQRGAHNFGSPL